jgi:hypothetical protein
MERWSFKDDPKEKAFFLWLQKMTLGPLWELPEVSFQVDMKSMTTFIAGQRIHGLWNGVKLL